MNTTAVALLTTSPPPPWNLEVGWFMFTWVLPAICFFGVITNLINIVIFSHSELKEDIYKYMLAYSVSDFIYTFCVFFTWVSRSRYPHSSSYFAKWYEIYIFFIALNGMGTMSALVEIAISFDRLFLIRKACVSMSKIPAYLIIGIMFVVSALTGAIYAGVRSIKGTTTTVYDPELNETLNVTKYSTVFNEFGTGVEGKTLYVVVTVIKNIGTIIVMIAVNSFLIVEMNKYYQRKQRLTKKNTQAVADASTNQQKDENQDRKLRESDHMNRFIKMVVSLFAVYLIGNLTNAIIGVLFIYYSRLVFFQMILTFGDVPQFLCRGLNIFIYYRFNNRFRNIFDRRFRFKSANNNH